MLYVFIIIALASVYFTIKRKQALLLTVPFFAMFAYLIFQVAMVPLGFIETVQLILSLK